MTKRNWFRVHSFTGVITGLMLFVVCWSGTFATISQEIDWLVTPQERVDPAGDMLPWGRLVAAVQAAHPDAKVNSVQAPLYTRSAADVMIERPGQGSIRVYVDPYTAEVKGDYSYFNVQRFFRSLHMNLFLSKFGYYTVLFFGVTLLVSTVAALYFYRRWWSRFFRMPKGPGHVFWSELHKTAGLWSLWFLLVIGITSVWYLFEMVRMDALDGKVSYAGEIEYAIHVPPKPSSEANLPTLSLDQIIKRATALRPDIRIAGVRFNDNGEVYIDGQSGHVLVRDRANKLQLDGRTGEVLYNQNASDLPLYWRWSDTADPLHFGDFAGLTTKLIWFVFGLILSGLILTGTYLHARRLAREAGKHDRARWPGTLAACVVSIGILAAAFPGGIQEYISYGPTVAGEKIPPELAPGVTAVILGWIAVTLAIVAAWVWMLWRPLAIPGHDVSRSRSVPAE